MSLTALLFGQPIRSSDAEEQKIGALVGVPILGLDALASAAYGPEALLTVFLLDGRSGLAHVLPLTGCIIALLLLVQLSYRQTIDAYPNGGGSFTVAKENLGTVPGLVAASALFLDYLLNVAVAISAGVGALVSAVPSLLPHTLTLCLAILVLLTLVNLRGIRSTGAAFMAPTWLFVGTLTITVGLGAAKVLAGHGHPAPVVPPPHVPLAATGVGLWLILRSFASGCTAMTGIEAVSNGVPLFKAPPVRRAQATLSLIAATLALLLAGIAFLAQRYGVNATPPGEIGYQSVLSQLVAAVAGRGLFYDVTIGAVILVLCLSANTSFADFPRVCRLLALNEFLPGHFAHQGRRLVYSEGIVLLAVLSGSLLVAFGGITDRLIPLFAIGAFTAFTLSQAGMVAHWKRVGGPRAGRSRLFNGLGAAATAATLVVLIASKFLEGAWISIVFIAATVTLFLAIRRHFARVDREVRDAAPLELAPSMPPLVVVPLKRLDRIARKGLRLALTLSPDIYVVQVRTDEQDLENLPACWQELVETPLRKAGLPVPKVVTLRSTYRQLVDPLLGFVHQLCREHPGRTIAVLIPELVERRWYHAFLHGHGAATLRLLLLWRGGPQVVVIEAPWRPGEGRTSIPRC